jgi:hypothetical protein
MRCGLLEHQERMNFMACKLIYGLSGVYLALTGVTGGFQEERVISLKGERFFLPVTLSLRTAGRTRSRHGQIHLGSRTSIYSEREHSTYPKGAGLYPIDRV